VVEVPVARIWEFTWTEIEPDAVEVVMSTGGCAIPFTDCSMWMLADECPFEFPPVFAVTETLLTTLAVSANAIDVPKPIKLNNEIVAMIFLIFFRRNPLVVPPQKALPHVPLHVPFGEETNASFL